MSEVVDIYMMDTESGAESIVERWLKKEGERVELNEPLVEVSTDKVSLEIPSPASGVLVKIFKQANDRATATQSLGKIELSKNSLKSEIKEEISSAQGAPKFQEPLPQSYSSQTVSSKTDEPRLSPAVRRFLRENPFDVRKVVGTGRSGRVTYKDVSNYWQNQTEKTFKGEHPSPTLSKSSLAQSKPRDSISSEFIPHSPMRLRIAEHMVTSMLQTAPHVTSVFEADLSAVKAHREKHKKNFLAQGVKLTYTAYFISAVVAAIQAVPEVNSRWHENATEVFKDCNIGIATAIEKGLVVPVLLQAQNLSLLGVAQELGKMTKAAREQKIDPKSLQNGTFTITNHGVSGSLLATPIINQPQSAILGIGKMEKRVVVKEYEGRDVIEICPMCYVTLTIDHRVLDGFQANAFLSHFVQKIENWRL